MADSSEITRVRLPVGVQADDVLALFEQIQQRVAAILLPEGASRRKSTAPAVTLPADLTPMPKLPDFIGGPWGRFESSVAALAAIRDSRDRAAAGAAVSDVAATRAQANDDCDGSFRAFESWLDGWTQHGDDGEQPSAADAQWLYQSLFAAPEGLRFINLRPRRQWMAMKPRMEVLAGERAQAIIKGFGGVRQYKRLVATHAEFGRAFGFLAVVADEATGESDTRPEFLGAKEALRDLVRKLDSYAEPTVPGSEALSAFLLRPYLDLAAELSTSRPARKPAPAPTTPENG